MRRLLGAEFQKVLSLRVNVVLAVAAVALVVAPTVAVFLTELDLPHDVALRFVDDGAPVLIALGVMAMTSEFRHGTAAKTFLMEPCRDRVLAAKAATYACVGAALALLMVLTHLGAMWTGAHLAGERLGLSGGTLLRAYGGYVFGGALWSVLGVAVGALVVNQPAALGVALLWPTVVEGAIRILWERGGRYLPGSALAALARSRDGATVGWAGAAFLLLTYVLIIGTCASWSLRRRDVPER